MLERRYIFHGKKIASSFFTPLKRRKKIESPAPPMESPPHKMPFTMSAATIGSQMSGTNWNLKLVSGTIVAIHPGLGFTVVKDLYYYLIIDNFSAATVPFNNHIEGSPQEFMNICLTKATVMFWLSQGPAKSVIYGKEIRQKQLINPLSHEGLIMDFKLAPLIKPTTLNHNDEANEFYLKFGSFPGHSDIGNSAPLPFTAMVIQEEKCQMDDWHLARAKLQKTTDIEGNYRYHFLECGHKLRVELDGQKMSLIHFNFHGTHKTPYSSPALTFTLRAPPDVTGLDLSVETPLGQKEFNLTNLTASALYEGIEEAHWEQRRIRAANPTWYTDPVYTNSTAWVDAAWDEIQERREEENSAPFSAEDEDAVESHY